MVLQEETASISKPITYSIEATSAAENFDPPLYFKVKNCSKFQWWSMSPSKNRNLLWYSSS